MTPTVPCLTSKSNFTELSSFGHSAFGAGVTVTMVETSNVGVKVGIVGRGVIVMVGVVDGSDVRVGDGVDVETCVDTVGTFVVDGAQALIRKTMAQGTCKSDLFMDSPFYRNGHTSAGT